MATTKKGAKTPGSGRKALPGRPITIRLDDAVIAAIQKKHPAPIPLTSAVAAVVVEKMTEDGLLVAPALRAAK